MPSLADCLLSYLKLTGLLASVNGFEVWNFHEVVI